MEGGDVLGFIHTKGVYSYAYLAAVVNYGEKGAVITREGPAAAVVGYQHSYGENYSAKAETKTEPKNRGAESFFHTVLSSACLIQDLCQNLTEKGSGVLCLLEGVHLSAYLYQKGGVGGIHIVLPLAEHQGPHNAGEFLRGLLL